MKRALHLAALVALASLGVLAVPATARAEWQGPAEAERRFQEALALSKQKDRHLESAAAYRAVADWPAGGEFRERAQALFYCAQQLEVAGELERAVATYREIEARFSKDAFAGIARRNVDRLEPPGVVGGLEFQRRHAAAVAGLPLAFTLAERRELAQARPALERSLDLLAGLFRDYPKHPRAVDVAITISDILVRLERLDEALGAGEQALALAKERAAAADASATAAAEVVSAGRQLDEARRAIRLVRFGRVAKGLLVVLAGALAALRPWRRVNGSVVKLLLVLGVLDALCAAAGAAGADYVRKVHVPSSPIDNGMAALLVFVPGAIGILLAVGFTLSLRGKRGALLGAAAGFVGALSATTVLVQRYGFFDFLPDL